MPAPLQPKADPPLAEDRPSSKSGQELEFVLYSKWLDLPHPATYYLMRIVVDIS